MENSLHDLLYKFMYEYADELDAARKTENYKRPFGILVRKDIVKKLKDSIADETYYVKGSVGAGRWTDVPWIAVFDTRLTKSAQKGVYIVYLLNKDTKQLYLTFNQGATDVAQDGISEDGKLIFTGIASSSKEVTLNKLKKRAGEIREHLEISLPNMIQSGSPAYDAGCICSKVYSVDCIPNDEILYSDLQEFLKLYKKYYAAKFESKDENPSETELKEKQIEEKSEEKVPMLTKEAIAQIKTYIAACGFNYKDELIENFYLSLKSKPFVILAGTSGTGKTRLVKLFAEAIGADCKLVSVRPDWSDGSDLFGHYDLNGKFIKGPVCDCFDLAYANRNKPVFLCLDEMNLARVEYYLSDFLSVIESREKRADGKVVTSPIAQYDQGIPDNLYIVGTVNMDETTFPFSKKVLDRANTIEFSYVDLIPDFELVQDTVDALKLPNSFMRTEYLVLARDCLGEQEYVRDICMELQKINEILLKANAHVGYRVRDEIVFYMLNNKVEGSLLSHEEALDNEIMQKILPRIQGSSVSIRDMLCELFVICAADYNQKTGDTESEKMRKVLGDTSIVCHYRRSAEKLELMVRRFEEDGFTSYWL